MAKKHKGKLELNWVDKGDIILTKFNENGKTYPASYFHGQVSDEELMPRELDLVKSVGDPDSENMLIMGENLIALRSIEREFAGQIKFIYFDPPFNTGQDFEDYEDGLEHSIWLTLMENRLRILHRLLDDEGAIFIEIDQAEEARLKLLLDEVFDSKNYITTVSIKRSASTGHKAINPGMVNVSEYMLVYAKDKQKWRYKRLFVQREKYDKQYSKYILNINRNYEDWQFANLADIVAKQFGFENAKVARKQLGKSQFDQKYVEFAIENAKSVIRFAIPNYEGVSKAARKLIDKSKTITNVLKLGREDYPDMYFYRGDRILFLSDKINEEGLVEPLTNFWSDISWQGIASEGNVILKKGKKPERLIKRLINLCDLKVNEYVLDIFAGSGTTGAVAHKMGRKWIMIELREDMVKEKAFKRMKNVVEGDPTGISKEVGWKGGGGFKFYKLGEPLIIKHKEYPSIKIINPKYYNGPLVKVICKLEGFQFKKNDKVFQGVNKLGNKFTHVTEQYISQGYIEFLKSKLADNEELIVYCFSYDDKINLPFNILIKKLPDDLGKPYQLRLRA